MEFSELLLKRRSIRQYTGESVPAEHIRKILEAGLRAPNACNAQLWHFYVLVGKERIDGLIPEVCRQEWIKKTAFVVVITENAEPLNARFGEAKGNLFVAEDAGAAAENMSLTAAELGYASCFVGAFDEDKCRDYVGAKPEQRPVLLLPVGVPAADVPLRDRKSFEEAVTFLGDPAEAAPEQKDEGPFRIEHRYLPGAVFDDVGMPKAAVNNALLEGARFTDINFRSGFFGGITFEGSFFGSSDMKDSTVEDVDLSGAHFVRVDFTDAVFEDCKGLD